MCKFVGLCACISLYVCMYDHCMSMYFVSILVSMYVYMHIYTCVYVCICRYVHMC